MKKSFFFLALICLLALSFAQAGMEKEFPAVHYVFHAPKNNTAAAAPAALIQDEKQVLIGTLLNQKADIRERRAAASALKNYAQGDSCVARALLFTGSDPAEAESLKIETLRSLSRSTDLLLSLHKTMRTANERKAWVDRAAAIASDKRRLALLLSPSARVRDWLLALGSHNVFPVHKESSRAMALMALYSTNQDHTRNSLLALAENASQPWKIRKAAAWALFNGMTDKNRRDRMLALAENSLLNEELRVEVLKSLFQAMPNPDVYARVKALAANAKEKEAVRVTAVRLLQNVNGKPEIQKFLQSMLKDAKNSPALRAAAAKALNRFQDIETVRYFHLDSFNGHPIDPLLD